jgi:hypothetical protein
MIGSVRTGTSGWPDVAIVSGVLASDVAVVVPIRRDPPMGFLVEALASVYRLECGTVFYMDGSGGTAAAMNQGVRDAVDAGYDWFFWHAADDTCGWDLLEKLAAAHDGEAEIVFPNIEVVGDDGEHRFFWGSEFDPGKLYEVAQIPGIAVVHKDVWGRAGGFPDLPYGPDWGLYATAYAAKPFQAIYVPDAVYRWRQHRQSESGDAEANLELYAPLNALLNELDP